MCTGGKTVVQQQPTVATGPEKKPIYMRNSWLDGLGINAEQRGRNSLRIDRSNSGGLVAPPMVPVGTGLGIGMR